MDRPCSWRYAKLARARASGGVVGASSAVVWMQAVWMSGWSAVGLNMPTKPPNQPTTMTATEGLLIGCWHLAGLWRPAVAVALQSQLDWLYRKVPVADVQCTLFTHSCHLS
jgi:hypothetical protein